MRANVKTQSCSGALGDFCKAVFGIDRGIVNYEMLANHPKTKGN